MSELNTLGKIEECTKQVSDKGRLISYSENYNMSLYYTSQDANYPNVENIKKILSDSDYSSWLYCNSVNCGNARGWWWTMGLILTPTPAMIGLRAMRLTPVTCTTTLARVRMGCVPS